MLALAKSLYVSVATVIFGLNGLTIAITIAMSELFIYPDSQTARFL